MLLQQQVAPLLLLLLLLLVLFANATYNWLPLDNFVHRRYDYFPYRHAFLATNAGFVRSGQLLSIVFMDRSRTQWSPSGDFAPAVPPCDGPIGLKDGDMHHYLRLVANDEAIKCPDTSSGNIFGSELVNGMPSSRQHQEAATSTTPGRQQQLRQQHQQQRQQ
jgi:hypothetical protein